MAISNALFISEGIGSFANCVSRGDTQAGFSSMFLQIETPIASMMAVRSSSMQISTPPRFIFNSCLLGVVLAIRRRTMRMHASLCSKSWTSWGMKVLCKLKVRVRRPTHYFGIIGVVSLYLSSNEEGRDWTFVTFPNMLAVCKFKKSLVGGNVIP